MSAFALRRKRQNGIRQLQLRIQRIPLGINGNLSQVLAAHVNWILAIGYVHERCALVLASENIRAMSEMHAARVGLLPPALLQWTVRFTLKPLRR